MEGWAPSRQHRDLYPRGMSAWLAKLWVIAQALLGQALTGGLLFWRGRRLRGAPSAPMVEPGLRPRFFSVFPTPANFRSR